MFPLCQTTLPINMRGTNIAGAMGATWTYKATSPDGLYVAVHQHASWTTADAYCKRNYPGGNLASIHNLQQNEAAWNICNQLLGNIWDANVSPAADPRDFVSSTATTRPSSF